MAVDESSSNEFYDNLCRLIDMTERKIRSSTHHYGPLVVDAVNYVTGAFYANLIRLYQHNMNEEFFRTVDMSREDQEELRYRLNPFFHRANVTDESVFNEGDLNFFVYQDFRRTIYDFGDDAYWLLLGVEGHADIIRCEHRIIKFKTDILSLM
ncbi:MAG: hypothetical protein ACMUIG_00365 [Thermoplasmatota archaeon]